MLLRAGFVGTNVCCYIFILETTRQCTILPLSLKISSTVSIHRNGFQQIKLNHVRSVRKSLSLLFVESIIVASVVISFVGNVMKTVLYNVQQQESHWFPFASNVMRFPNQKDEQSPLHLQQQHLIALSGL